jgi:hypothetical protein
MVPIMSLWLPILLSAVAVFALSSLVHTVFPYHKSDYAKVPDEDQVMAALRPFNLVPDDYLMPRPGTAAQMRSPEFLEKMKKGPIVLMTVRPSEFSMATNFIQWFVHCLVIGVFAAYVTGRALPPGAEYLNVFRFAGTVAFAGYALALPTDSIWFARKWSTTFKSLFDGLMYALLTAGMFGWLWPK